MGIFDYGDPIIVKKRLGNSSDPYIYYEEEYPIINNKVVLKEVVDEFQGIQVTNYYYTKSTSPTSNEFTCDFQNGILIFNSSENNKTVLVKFFGTGVVYWPSSRVYVETNNQGEIIETLKSLTDTTTQARDTSIQTNTEISNAENTRITQETQRQTNTTNAINNLNTAVSKTIIEYKTPVATFADISITYPTPQDGWGVQVVSDGKVYRYNATSKTWNYILAGNIIHDIHILWQEEKTILTGSNSFTLLNSVSDGDILKITDKKYCVEWFEGKHYTRNGQIITLTESSLLEDLTFRVLNFGH